MTNTINHDEFMKHLSMDILKRAILRYLRAIACHVKAEALYDADKISFDEFKEVAEIKASLEKDVKEAKRFALMCGYTDEDIQAIAISTL